MGAKSTSSSNCMLYMHTIRLSTPKEQEEQRKKKRRRKNLMHVFPFFSLFSIPFHTLHSSNVFKALHRSVVWCISVYHFQFHKIHSLPFKRLYADSETSIDNNPTFGCCCCCYCAAYETLLCIKVKTTVSVVHSIRQICIKFSKLLSFSPWYEATPYHSIKKHTVAE